MFLPPVQHIVRQSVGIGLALTDPYSRGTLRLASSDPDDPPLIDPGCKLLSATICQNLYGHANILEVIADQIITVYHKGEKAYLATIQMDKEFVEAVKE